MQSAVSSTPDAAKTSSQVSVQMRKTTSSLGIEANAHERVLGIAAEVWAIADSHSFPLGKLRRIENPFRSEILQRDKKSDHQQSRVEE